MNISISIQSFYAVESKYKAKNEKKKSGERRVKTRETPSLFASFFWSILVWYFSCFPLADRNKRKKKKQHMHSDTPKWNCHCRFVVVCDACTKKQSRLNGDFFSSSFYFVFSKWKIVVANEFGFCVWCVEMTSQRRVSAFLIASKGIREKKKEEKKLTEIGEKPKQLVLTIAISLFLLASSQS